MKSYQGKKVFVCGGSAGIGKATAIAAARAGASVYIAARRQSQLDEALDEIRAAAASKDQVFGTVSLDVTDREAIRMAAGEVLEGLGGLDVLILNQGFAITGYIQHLTDDDFDRMMDTNYFGHVHLVRAFLPHFMQQQSGAICLVSSMLGFMGVYGYTPYAASKHAIAGFARCLRAEMIPYNVTVTLAYPPTTDTPGLETENRTKPPETWAIEGTSHTYKPEEVAATILSGTARGKFEVVTGFGSWFIWFMVRVAPWFVDLFMDADLRKFLKNKKNEVG